MKKLIVGSFVSALLLVCVATTFTPSAVRAQDSPSSAGGVSALLPGGGLIPECLRDPEKARTQDISCLTDSITHFTNLLLLAVAVGAFAYMLYGAFLYASAFGDESKIGQAKKSITYAITGIVVALLADVIVQLVRSALKA